MAGILSLKESVLIYLDRSGGLQKLADDCRPLNGSFTVAHLNANYAN